MSGGGFAPAGRGVIADRAADVALEGPQPLGEGFRPYHRFDLELRGAHGARLHQRRDILRVGPVVGVLAADPNAGCFVLIRQFRLAAHLATGRGDIVELVAGCVDAGEEPEVAARRECVEEIGVAPDRLMPILSFMPTPGVTDEQAAVYLGRVDSARVPAKAGAAVETELTEPFTIPIDEALGALERGAAQNLFLIAALQWFALNRARAEHFLRTA